MSHTTACATVARPDTYRQCDCFEPNTDWSPDEPCGGIAISSNGGPFSEPPWCETHMKPWGHRRTPPASTTPEEI
jgi:hypothetical protein